MEQESKIALVTGASRGIGASIALQLAQDGFWVAVNYKDSHESAAGVVRSIQAMGGRAVALRADVSNSGNVSKMVKEIEERFGRLDLLVNNAGMVRDGLVQNMTEEDWDAVIDTNLKSVFLCSKAVIKIMRRQRRGRMINLASIVGQQGRPGQANYAAAKAGVIAFSKSLALELAPFQVTVNVVVPGFTDTDMTRCLPERAKAKILERIPMGRSCSPAEIAKMVSYLASEDAGYITAQVFNIDCRIG